ncbi:MAG TPA: amidohydrolase family protein [Terracidiphilus sp.]|nr:amidohydrolase family protein [Terracidiphilus sp.]
MDTSLLADRTTRAGVEHKINRRAFLAGAAASTALAVAPGAVAQLPPMDEIPIIDTHIHLFDGTRPLGADYMGSPAYQAISQTSLPSMYSALARPAGIIGAMVVESCAWIDENLWYLEMCRTDPIMMGVTGTLDSGSPIFGSYLERFHKDPLFRAIRARIFPFYNEDNGRVTLKPEHVSNLKLLAQAGLVLDTANPSMGLMRANVLLAEAIPDLRIMMDHLPSFDPTPENQKAYEAVVSDMAKCPNIFVKLSEVYHPRESDGVVVMEYETLRARLEHLYSAFGEDRVLFGSDYPNSYGIASIADQVALMKRFYSGKSRESAEKYFWKNALRIYGLKLT